MFADVIVGLSVEKLDKAFTYSVPEYMKEEMEDLIGARVIVPFGKGNKEIDGFIIGLREEVDFDESFIKSILRKDERGLGVEKNLIKLAEYIRLHFGGTMNEALRTVVQIPRTIERKKKRTVVLVADVDYAKERLHFFKERKYVAKVRVLEKAIEEKNFSYEDFIKEKSCSLGVFSSLSEEGLIEIKEEFLYRKAITPWKSEEKQIILSEEQSLATKKVIRGLSNTDSHQYLLFGVTGSGKTEVYMEVIEEVIKRGKQVIFLIPEISLTFQMVERLSHRFGDRISIMNSKMSAGERYDQYLRALHSEIDVMVGPRSALFTPFQNLGLIIMDEEHSESYNSSKTPRYHAREVAIKRAELEGADIILGSATPSLTAVKLASEGKLEVLSLRQRPKGVRLPQIEVVDLREEIKNKNFSIFSKRLVGLIEEGLAKKEQTMLFINRRGYAGFVSCRSCGEPLKCPNCEVSLTFHKPNRLLCHYCGYEKEQPKVCPSCSSPHIKTFGIGTEKVEEMIKKTFPTARVLRMDADTTSGKHGHEEIIKAFRDGNYDILVGTQMIVKGHDFPKVTLVGILAADLSLYSNDFRSSERTYQLLVQAAGRAGRGEILGRVVIQTYRPEHYVIKAAADGNYKEFYEKELRFRRLASYPPTLSMLQIFVTGKESEETFRLAEELRGSLIEKMQEGIKIHKTVWDVIPKVNNIYKAVILIKAVEKKDLISIKTFVEEEGKKEKYKKGNISFDFPT